MRIFMASLALVSFAACGGSDSKDPGTVNPQSARTSIDQVGRVNASLAASDGAQAASAVAAMTAAGQGIVSPSAPSGLVGLAPDHLPRPTVLSAVHGTATCTPTGCTFDNYGDDSPGQSFTIDGTISKAGDRISFDLTYDVDSQGTSVHWTIDGAVTVTPTSIDGVVDSTGTTSGGPAGNVSWDVSVHYDAVQLDGTGCPIGGSITASTSYEAAGQGIYNVEGTVSFGPTCGESH